MMQEAREVMALNGITNVSIFDALSPPELPLAEAMISIDAVEVMRCDHAHAMFAFARNHVRPGGFFLILSRRSARLIDQLITLERLRYEGLYRGARRYAATLRSALEASLSPQIQVIPRARHYWHPEAIPLLAAEYGFTVEQASSELAKRNNIRHFDWFSKGAGGRRRWFRWSDWYLLRRT